MHFRGNCGRRLDKHRIGEDFSNLTPDRFLCFIENLNAVTQPFSEFNERLVLRFQIRPGYGKFTADRHKSSQANGCQLLPNASMRNIFYPIIVDSIRFSGCICPCVGIAFPCCTCALYQGVVNDCEFAIRCFTAVDVEPSVVYL